VGLSVIEPVLSDGPWAVGLVVGVPLAGELIALGMALHGAPQRSTEHHQGRGGAVPLASAVSGRVS
jgi:hypothetical protein